MSAITKDARHERKVNNAASTRLRQKATKLCKFAARCAQHLKNFEIRTRDRAKTLRQLQNRASVSLKDSTKATRILQDHLSSIGEPL